MIKKTTQNKVDEPGPQLVVKPPPQGQFPLSGMAEVKVLHVNISWIYSVFVI